MAKKQQALRLLCTWWPNSTKLEQIERLFGIDTLKSATIRVERDFPFDMAQPNSLAKAQQQMLDFEGVLAASGKVDTVTRKPVNVSVAPVPAVAKTLPEVKPGEAA